MTMNWLTIYAVVEGIAILAVLVVLFFLIRKRIDDKKKENFERRDN